MGALALAAAAFIATQSIAPRTIVAPQVAFVIAFTCVAGTTLASSWLAPVMRPRQLWLLMVPSLALAWSGAHPESRGAQALVVMVSLLSAGTLVGGVIGSRVQAAGHLVFVALVSSAADIFSVYAPIGPTAAVLESPTSLNLVALPWPLPGTELVPPILGVGDVVFASLYRSAARAHGLSRARTLGALITAFALTMVTLLWSEVPVPALPFLGLTIVVAHPEARRVPEADRKRGWFGALALLLLLAIFASYRG